MRNKKALVIGTLLVLLVGAVALTAQQRNITVKGSDTLVILGQRWAEVFMKKNPRVTVQVTGDGSGTGIAAQINGTTDIAEDVIYMVAGRDVRRPALDRRLRLNSLQQEKSSGRRQF